MLKKTISSTNSKCNCNLQVYLQGCLGQENAKKLFGIRDKLSPAKMSTTHGGSLTLSFLMLQYK